jgi:putative ABC transport system permease protein
VAAVSSRRHHLTVGSPLAITSLRGTTLHLTVRGIEDSPVLDVLGLGPVTISDAAYDGAFDNRRNRLTLVDGPVGAIRKALAPYPDAKVLTKAGFVDDQTAFIGQLLAILWVLLALAVIVSLFGIVNTLALSIYERTRELGMVRAIGMSRRQVRTMVRYESVITALIGAVLGLALGVVFAALIAQPLKAEGFTLSYPIGSLVALLVLAAIAGVLAAILPARRAARLDVLDSLQYE